MIKRRQFLKFSAAGLVLSQTVANPMNIAMAAAPTQKRLITIILRGGLDGLAAVPPLGDPNYKSARHKMALSNGQNLDGYFALHPSLSALYPFYQKGEMTIFHAIASPYRSRSHFDAQNLLENGTNHANGAHDGWLNRALSLYPSAQNSSGIAIGQQIPFILSGTSDVTSWAPAQSAPVSDDIYMQIQRMYDTDPQMHQALTKGMATHDMADMALSNMDQTGGGARKNQIQQIKAMAKLLREDKGARFATMEVGGWDTHAQQGLEQGKLANQFKQLADGITLLAKELAPIWQDCCIQIVSEFGRTVASNGTGGTDHGTAGIMILIGGGVKGGKVISDWPGLAKNQLYEGRDLFPTMDIRSVFKASLTDHMGLPLADINRSIFPQSSSAKKINRLFKA